MFATSPALLRGLLEGAEPVSAAERVANAAALAVRTSEGFSDVAFERERAQQCDLIRDLLGTAFHAALLGQR